MYQDLPIQDIYAREILDSRGNPTVEVEILAGEKIVGRAALPSGRGTFALSLCCLTPAAANSWAGLRLDATTVGPADRTMPRVGPTRASQL